MTTTSFVFVDVKMWYPESVPLLNVREKFCERLTVTVSRRATRELTIQRHPSHILFTGRDYMLTWQTLSVRVPHVQRQRVAIIKFWEFHNSRLYQYNHSLGGPWI